MGNIKWVFRAKITENLVFSQPVTIFQFLVTYIFTKLLTESIFYLGIYLSQYWAVEVFFSVCII